MRKPPPRRKCSDQRTPSIIDAVQARRAAGAIPRSGLGRRGAATLRSLALIARRSAAKLLPLAAALGRVLADDVIAPVDAPPFDRSNVDGFAVRAADTGRRQRPMRRGGSCSMPKSIACGVAPAVEVLPGTATAIATGGVIPRGADAVVMIEHTELIEDGAVPAIELRRAVGQRPVHFLRRLRHRARRNAAAPRHAHRLARDRHAGGLRAGGDRGRAPAARRGALDRRRAG